MSSLTEIVRIPARSLSTRVGWVRFDHALDVRPRPDLVRLGSEYGGYVVPLSLFGQDSVCYSCGIGEDATFDLDLIARTGCTVYAFDPVPRAAAYARPIAEREHRFHFYRYGIWITDGPKRFYSPADERHVSHSIGNLQGTERSFEAECRSLESLMAEHGHKRIDLLKLDVEGAEYEILEAVVDRELDVRVLCAEFHKLTTVAHMIEFVRTLSSSGYTVSRTHQMNVTLVRDEYMDEVPARAPAS